MLEAQSNGRLGSWSPFDDLPHVYKQHFPALQSDSTILLQRHLTYQDDVQRDVRTLLLLGIPTTLLKFSMPNRCLQQLFAISYNDNDVYCCVGNTHN